MSLVVSFEVVVPSVTDVYGMIDGGSQKTGRKTTDQILLRFVGNETEYWDYISENKTKKKRWRLMSCNMRYAQMKKREIAVTAAIALSKICHSGMAAPASVTRFYE